MAKQKINPSFNASMIADASANNMMTGRMRGAIEGDPFDQQYVASEMAGTVNYLERKGRMAEAAHLRDELKRLGGEYDP
jgi:hypothetical protein